MCSINTALHGYIQRIGGLPKFGVFGIKIQTHRYRAQLPLCIPSSNHFVFHRRLYGVYTTRCNGRFVLRVVHIDTLRL